MVCLYCSSKTKVTNSRSSTKRLSTWRRRECASCKSIFTTREDIDYSSALRVKDKHSHLEPFSRDKLLVSMRRSISHRKDSLRDAADLTDTIIAKLANSQIKGLLTTCQIIETAEETLKRFDKAAAIHYQAHHS